jgi:hypothetical protein
VAHEYCDAQGLQHPEQLPNVWRGIREGMYQHRIEPADLVRDPAAVLEKIYHFLEILAKRAAQVGDDS